MLTKEDKVKEVENFSDDKLTAEDIDFFDELNEDIEKFDAPKETEKKTDIATIEETETSPFKKNTSVIITESTEKAAEKLLNALNETIANIVGAFSSIDKDLLLPEKDKVKDLSKELAVLMPQLHIGKGTGLIMAVTSCYVPVATNVIIEARKNKNNEKSKTFDVVRYSGNGQNNTDKTDN